MPTHNESLEIAAQESDVASDPHMREMTGPFISQHTVAYHLRKVFSKLDITWRRHLDPVLPNGAGAPGTTV